MKKSHQNAQSRNQSSQERRRHLSISAPPPPPPSFFSSSLWELTETVKGPTGITPTSLQDAVSERIVHIQGNVDNTITKTMR